MFSIALLGAFVSGLSLCNQHTIVFYLFPISLSILFIFYELGLSSWRLLASLAGAFFLGLLPYLYLVVASITPKIGSWGDMTSWNGFLTELLRKEYGTFRLFSGSGHTNRGTMFLYGLFQFFYGTFTVRPCTECDSRILLALESYLHASEHQWCSKMLLRPDVKKRSVFTICGGSSAFSSPASGSMSCVFTILPTYLYRATPCLHAFSSSSVATQVFKSGFGCKDSSFLPFSSELVFIF